MHTTPPTPSTPADPAQAHLARARLRLSRLDRSDAVPVEIDLYPGDLIGRVAAARLRLIDAPGVSEAHALLSLRDATLTLIGLRGPIPCRDTVPLAGSGALGAEATATELPLAVGLLLRIGDVVLLEVVELVLPAGVWALGDWDHAGPTPLPAPECAIVLGPEPRLVIGHAQGADALLWVSGDTLHAKVGVGAIRQLAVGDRLELRGRVLRVLSLPIREASAPRTVTPGWLRVELSAAAVTLQQRPSGRPLRLEGNNFALVVALLRLRGLPQADPRRHWAAVAKAVWGRSFNGNNESFRKQVKRLRAELTKAGFASHTVDSDGGQWWFDLGQRHELIDPLGKVSPPPAG
jgi:hypothetical protein